MSAVSVALHLHQTKRMNKAGYKFRKQVEKSADKKNKKRLIQIIRIAEQAKSLSTIPNLKKLKGGSATFDCTVS